MNYVNVCEILTLDKKNLNCLPEIVFDIFLSKLY